MTATKAIHSFFFVDLAENRPIHLSGSRGPVTLKVVSVGMVNGVVTLNFAPNTIMPSTFVLQEEGFKDVESLVLEIYKSQNRDTPNISKDNVSLDHKYCVVKVRCL